MPPIRVLLADDHLMITEALAARLSTADDLWVAGRCAATDPSLLEVHTRLEAVKVARAAGLVPARHD